jgi:hypothetical protein
MQIAANQQQYGAVSQGLPIASVPPQQLLVAN